MPIGPYKTFADCVTAQQNKGKSANVARAICGAMEKQMNANVAYDDKGKFYVKAFLVDDTVNLNHWAITKDSIPKNINTFVGKPLILTEQFDHPEVPGGERLSHWLASQESYRVGTIIDIVQKHNAATSGTEYHAIIEVTNDNLKQALKDNTVPLYVSPGIAEFLNPAAAVAARSQGRQALELVDNWAGVHLAIVSEPAFGIKKAVINETCGGDEQGCLLQLRKAHIQRYGDNNCGFCVKKALNKLEILHTARVLAKVKQQTPINTSQFANLAADTRKKQLSQLENITNAGNSENTEQTNNNQQQSNETPIATQPQQQINKQPLKQIPTTTSISDLMQINQKLLQENELLRIKNDELTGIKDTLGERIAALELHGRREKIERIITADIIKDDKQRLEKIKYFVGTSIPLQEIEELYNGLKVTLRKASRNSGGSGGRVPYYTAGDSVLSSAGQPANSNQNITDEETGLTPLQKQLAVLEGGI